MNSSNASLFSSTSTSSLSSVMIVTPPCSGKDVLASSTSSPPRPSCIHHNHNPKKQQSRQVSWGLCDEIIMVVHDDDTNENPTASTTTMDSRDMSVMLPNLPIQVGSTIPNFPMSVTTFDSGYGSRHGSRGAITAATNHGIDTSAGAATTYLELEQQFRLSPRPPLPIQGINHHNGTWPFQSFVHFRTNPVHDDDDDDDSSCFTDINNEEEDMDRDMNHKDLDFFYRGMNHHPLGIPNDDDDEEEEEEEHHKYLQTPDHTMYYYYDPRRQLSPQQRTPSAFMGTPITESSSYIHDYKNCLLLKSRFGFK